MKIVAFDAKRFQRIKKTWNADKTKEHKTTIFISQLGIGVTIPDPDAFVKYYVKASKDLKQTFGLDYTTPFFSSTCLKDQLGVSEAADFASQMISRMQDHIEAVHCSYITIPDPEANHIEVGGIRCVKTRMPAIRFIEKMGSMFSYITALGYIWTHDDTDFSNLEMHIDAFRSYRTAGWDVVKRKAPTKIFYKGDECNPFISCADLIAFYVDHMLASKWKKLFPEEIKSVLEPYKFDTTIWYFNLHSQNYYVWNVDQMINISSHLARPVVFLSIDRLATESHGQEVDMQASQDESVTGKSRKSDWKIRQTEIYQAALKYAYQKNGCMKFFSADEDKDSIKSGDVFIYAGPNSEKISKTLQDMADIQIYSGLEAIQLVKKS